MKAAGRELEPPPVYPGPAPQECGDLAAELAATFGRMVDGYRKFFAASAEEAARRPADAAAASIDHALNCPPDQVSWLDLYAVSQSDPEKSLARWEEVKAAALEELRNGFQAARALDVAYTSCWERAQFLALRADLLDEWRPRNGLERQLIDQLAQHRTLLARWQGTLANYTALCGFSAKRSVNPDAPPRVSDAEALDLAGRMVERFSRLYLLTLRALLDQRRLNRPVIVRQA